MKKPGLVCTGYVPPAEVSWSISRASTRIRPAAPKRAFSHCTIAAKHAVTRNRKPTVPAARTISRPTAQCSTDIRATVWSTPIATTGSQPASAIRHAEAPAASARRFIGVISM
ncbi:hypothetical protein SVIOM74S_08383 [Streptomyces violarus]